MTIPGLATEGGLTRGERDSLENLGGLGQLPGLDDRGIAEIIDEEHVIVPASFRRPATEDMEVGAIERLQDDLTQALVKKQGAEATLAAQKQMVGMIAEEFELAILELQKELQNAIEEFKAGGENKELTQFIHELANKKLDDVVAFLESSQNMEGFVLSSENQVEEINTKNLSELEIRKKEAENIRKEIEKMSEEHDASMRHTIHDLKHPLNSVVQWFQSFSQGHLKPDLDLFKLLQEELAAGIGMIRKLKASDHGEITFHPQKISDLGWWLEGHILETSGALSAKKGIRVENNVASGITLEVDPICLRRVINNLLNNAIKFTPRGGKITILGQTNEVGNVILGIKNTGEGIPQEKLRSLLDGKIHESTDGTSGEKGTGIGLSFCKRVADAAGGRFFAESQVGEYVTFSLEFPSRIK